MQALYLMALEPIAETYADHNSYGFRRGRSTADAIEQCFNVLSRADAPEWILEGDIKGCFDHLSHRCARRDMSLAEASRPAIGGVAEHGPDDRAFPAARLARRDTFVVESPCDLPDAASLDRVHLVHAPHDTGLAFLDNVGGGCLVGLAHVTVSIRSVAQHAHLARLRPMSLAAARALQDLRPFILRDHALKLNQELIFRAVTLRRLDKQCLDSVASEFLDEQNLVRILTCLLYTSDAADE